MLGDNEWCTADDPCFSCEEQDHQLRHPALVDDCETCRLRSLQVSPAATPTKTRQIAPIGSKNLNSWERGVKCDERGVPYLRSNGDQISVKEYGEQRHAIDALIAEKHRSPAPQGATSG